jgi:hypothetical protein
MTAQAWAVRGSGGIGMTLFNVRDGAVFEELDGELLVLDPRGSELYRLVGDTAEAMQWARAGGAVGDLPGHLQAPMQELLDAGLVTADGWSRRRVIQASVAVAGGLFLLALPDAAMAQSFPEGGPGFTPAAPPPPPTFPTTPAVTRVGLASVGYTSYDEQPQPDVNLFVQVILSDGSRWDVTSDAVWTISGAGSNTVDPTGLVTYGAGHNVVKVSYAGFNRYIDVWGTAAAGTGTLQRIEVRPNSLTGTAGGDSFQFDAIALTNDPTFGTGPDNVSTLATWTTNNPAIATVDPTGLVTAVGPGIAKVTATYLGKTSTATWIINSGLWIHIIANAGASTFQMAASLYTGVSSTDESSNVTWISDNPGFASVDPFGSVTVTGTGVANISATLGADTSNAVQITA